MLHLISIDTGNSCTETAIMMNNKIIMMSEDLNNLIHDTGISMARSLAIPYCEHYYEAAEDLLVEGKKTWNSDDVLARVINDIKNSPEIASQENALTSQKFALKDWDVSSENPKDPNHEFPVLIERSPDNIGIEIGSIDSDHPQLTLMVEIDKGVPSMHIGGKIGGENALHIHSDNKGINIAPETPGSLSETNNALTYGRPGLIINHDQDNEMKPSFS